MRMSPADIREFVARAKAEGKHLVYVPGNYMPSADIDPNAIRKAIAEGTIYGPGISVNVIDGGTL